MLMNSFGGAIPNWSCQWGNQSSFTVDIHGTYNTCSAPSNYSDLICVRKTFDPSLHTVVSEWDLVCDRDWITQTITTIQMGGLLFGGLVAGQIADMFGRKPTYFLSMLMLFVFNLVAAFSTSWKMFAVLRSIGHGIQNPVARIGVMIVPQIVYVSQHTTGVMYFLCGVMFISTLCLIGVPETGKKSLTDTIAKKKKIYKQSRDSVMTNEIKDNKGFECEYSSHLSVLESL
ncbi:OCTN [Mytilus edulis]|uniref:SLC22A4_5 n=1 Tax=Mytilus edulis TaxID=6550 RepID=A0A8S3QVB1_MYTED|nr:OCTN [Mytilus edulis]